MAFLIYIQDIIVDLESECLLFADDTCIFASGEDPAITAEVLNRDLEKIGNKAKKWKVLFNASKGKDLIFSRNKYLFNSPPLGIWLSSTLDWDKQIQATILKANGKLSVLRSVKFLDRATLDLLYKLTIRSVLEYGMIVYHLCFNITEKRTYDCTRKCCKNSVFSMKIAGKFDSILSSL